MTDRSSKRFDNFISWKDYSTQKNYRPLGLQMLIYDFIFNLFESGLMVTVLLRYEIDTDFSFLT